MATLAAKVSYGLHLPNDTLSIAFQNTVLSLIPKQNATISVGCYLARHFKTEPIETVAFCFGISESTVFSNAIDSVSFGRRRP
jgi:hypothetical protein